jgi:dipeptidyl aminopeptidase/acylaminoacyl peptidase
MPDQGDVFLDVQSAGLGAAPITVLRSVSDGKIRSTVATMDLGPLRARGWKAPQRYRLRDADDQYDVYASVFYPSTYDPDAKYPVLDFVYGLASLAETPVTFPPGASHDLGTYYWRAQSVAEVGFIVVMLDAPGTPFRGYQYARESYGAAHVDSTLRHHVAAITQLAQHDDSLDIDRVGIFGHSGGGFTSTRALLFYPEFFKVAVSSSGSHDLLRLYGPEWGDRYIGPYDSNKDLYARMSNSSYRGGRGGFLRCHAPARISGAAQHLA